ncbi:MAG: efflux RND transporter periplasmic adaptor subunit [Pseudomonadota bacterium]
MAFSAFSIFPRFGLIAALAVLAACGDGRDTTGGSGAPRRGPQGPVAVIAQVVEFKTAQQQLEAVGTARARRSVVLYPPTAGEVTAVNFAAGDFVKAGDVLLELDARQERLAVDLAKVAVDEARQLLERYQRIEDTGAISASQIDEAKTALVGARIQLEQAQVALADRSLKAPFDGFLGLSQIDPGARVTTTTTVAQLDDRAVLFIDFPAPEEIFSSLVQGTVISAAPFSNPDMSREATLAAIDSQVEQTTRSFMARAVIENGKDDLRPGMSFRVGFSIPGRAWPTVPEAAIVWGSDGAYLWAIEDGVAQRKPLSIIARQEGEVLVDAAIARGSLIVAEGVQKVRVGSPVKTSAVRPPSAAPVGPDKLAR